MARLFGAYASGHILATSIGALSSTTAFGSFVAIIKKTNDNDTNILLSLWDGTDSRVIFAIVQSTNELWLGIDNLNTSAMGPTFPATDGWALIAVTKATGTATPRFHKYVYSSNTWTHSNSASTLVNGTAVGGSGSARIGGWQSPESGNADIAAAGVWSGVVLTDDQIESLPHSLVAWHSLDPDALWLLDQQVTTQNVPDLTGGGANQSSITGTTVSANSVPGFSYGADLFEVLSVSAAAPPPDLTWVRPLMSTLQPIR